MSADKTTFGVDGRKRGAQPGNTNAIKHGFYAKNFSPAEHQDLEAAPGQGLSDEIALLRVLIRRFACQVLAADHAGLADSAQYLSTISDAMTRLASLLRTDHLLGGAEKSIYMKRLEEVIYAVNEELNMI